MNTKYFKIQKTYKNINMENSIDDIDDSNILDILTELINHESPTQKSPTMSPKSFVKDVVRLELVTPKSGIADATGPSCSNFLYIRHIN